MNHHDHDHDLIMALAEGRLDAPAAEAARRDLTGCSECAEDLALQEAGLTALASLSDARLTEMEAARLKRDLDTALGHERQLVAAPPPRRRFNWVPIFSVAAVLVALVLVAPSLELLGGGSDDAGADLVAIAENDGAADTTAAGAPSAQFRVESATPTEEAPAADFDAAESATTTMVAAADDEAGGDAVDEVDELLTTLAGALDAEDSPAEWRLQATVYGLTVPADDDGERCLAEGREELGTENAGSFVVGDAASLEPPIRFTAHPIDAELWLVAHVDATCLVVGIAPPG